MCISWTRKGLTNISLSSQHSLNCIYIISCLQHMTCVMKNLTTEQSVTENSASPAGANRHLSAEVWSCTVPTAAVLKWWLSLWFLYHVSEEHNASVEKVNDSVKADVKWCIGRKHVSLRESVQSQPLKGCTGTYWVTELVLVDVKWQGGRNVSIISEDRKFGCSQLPSYHFSTRLTKFRQPADTGKYYSERLQQAWHTSWYKNTKDYHHLNS